MAKDDDEQKKADHTEKAVKPSEEARAEADDADEEGEEGDADADEGDEDGEEEQAAAPEEPAPKAAAEPAKPAAEPKPQAPKTPTAKSAPERPRPVTSRPAIERPRPIEPPPEAPAPVQSMGKRVVVFAGIFVALSAGLYFLPEPEQINGPRFKAGTTNDITITVVKEDATALACASSAEVSGKKCEFANKTDRNSGLSDATMLKPYTATDGTHLLAAGLWSQPALDASKMPSERFWLKCKYVVDGVMKSPLIRWSPSQAWDDKNPDWNTGTLKDCNIVPAEK